MRRAVARRPDWRRGAVGAPPAGGAGLGPPRGAHPLGLSFGEYVGLALAARGLAGFQKALSFATNQSPEAARFLQRLPELFPDADVRLFLPRVPRK